MHFRGRRSVRLVIDDQDFVVRYSDAINLPGKVKRGARSGGSRDNGSQRRLGDASRSKDCVEAGVS